MSDEYYGRVPALNGVSDRFEEGRKAGRAEAEAEIAALQAERDWLREMIAIGSQGRCMVCNWPVKGSVSEGCVPGNCSYRPEEHSPEYYGWLKRAKLIHELCSTPASGELETAWEADQRRQSGISYGQPASGEPARKP